MSKFKYYSAIRRKTKTVEVRLFEKMKSYDRYTHLLLHPGREFRKRVRTNLLARKAGVSKRRRHFHRSPVVRNMQSPSHRLRNEYSLALVICC